MISTANISNYIKFFRTTLKRGNTAKATNITFRFVVKVI